MLTEQDFSAPYGLIRYLGSLQVATDAGQGQVTLAGGFAGDSFHFCNQFAAQINVLGEPLPGVIVFAQQVAR